MVNPFDLNTDNMTRIAGFNLLMPRRVFFKLSGASGFKEKLYFNDYLLFYETEEECQRRMKDSLGLAPQVPLGNFERVDQAEIDKKLLKNVTKA